MKVMMIFAITFIMLVHGQITFTAQCTCTQLQSQQDCINMGCTWSGSSCSSTNCSAFKGEVICTLAMSRCVWSSSAQQCISNDCTTLRTKLVTSCSYYGCGQLATLNSDSSYSCTNSVQCSAITSQITCLQYYYCGWKNNSCYDEVCANQLFTAGCPSVRSGSSASRYSVLCFGSGFSCRNAVQSDIDGLYQFNCNSVTGYSHTWSTALNKCVPCGSTTSGSSSSSSTSTPTTPSTTNTYTNTTINGGQTSTSTSTTPTPTSSSTNTATTPSTSVNNNNSSGQTTFNTTTISSNNQTSTTTSSTNTNSSSTTTNTTTDSGNYNCSNCNNTFNNITYVNTFASILVLVGMILLQ